MQCIQVESIRRRWAMWSTYDQVIILPCKHLSDMADILAALADLLALCVDIYHKNFHVFYNWYLINYISPKMIFNKLTIISTTAMFYGSHNCYWTRQQQLPCLAWVSRPSNSFHILVPPPILCYFAIGGEFSATASFR